MEVVRRNKEKNEKGRIKNRERNEMGSREEGMEELGRRWNDEWKVMMIDEGYTMHVMHVRGKWFRMTTVGVGI